MKEKILLVGESPKVTTGFSKVLRYLAQYLVECGYFVRQLGWCQTVPSSKEEFGYEIYPVPGQGDYYGMSVFDKIVNDFRPDIVLSVSDVYAIDWIPYTLSRSLFKWIGAVTIDSHPIPKSWVETIWDIDYPVVCSKYALEVLKKQISAKKVYYLPYGVNMQIFYPQNKKQIRMRNEVPENVFILLYVGVNSFRKQIPRLLRAFNIFSSDKDDVVLYLHTGLVQSQIREGWYLAELLERENLIDKVIVSKEVAPRGISEDNMSLVFNVADVLVTAASCEGFGLPFIEAGACKVPSIGVDYSAISELVCSDFLCKAHDWYYHSPYGMMRALIDIEDLVDKMNKAYELWKKGELSVYGEKAYEIAQGYSWDKVLPLYDELIQKVLEDRKFLKENSLNSVGGMLFE